ncbi:Nuclear pore complex protein [Sarcoptes scabiei]|nr:Nuclear pore complex protein [Sarcoptes scabiei]
MSSMMLMIKLMQVTSKFCVCKSSWLLFSMSTDHLVFVHLDTIICLMMAISFPPLDDHFTRNKVENNRFISIINLFSLISNLIFSSKLSFFSVFLRFNYKVILEYIVHSRSMSKKKQKIFLRASNLKIRLMTIGKNLIKINQNYNRIKIFCYL